MVWDTGHGVSIYETSKPAFTVTYFLQQDHTYSNKATLPNSATPFGGHFLSNHHRDLSLPAKGVGEGYRQAWGRTDLLILLQEFARYYLAKKLSQAPAQEPETKAELLQAGEKNGILISPQKAGPALDLDLEKEPESELELEEPQKPVSSVV